MHPSQKFINKKCVSNLHQWSEERRSLSSYPCAWTLDFGLCTLTLCYSLQGSKYSKQSPTYISFQYYLSYVLTCSNITIVFSLHDSAHFLLPLNLFPLYFGYFLTFSNYYISYLIITFPHITSDSVISNLVIRLLFSFSTCYHIT